MSKKKQKSGLQHTVQVNDQRGKEEKSARGDEWNKEHPTIEKSHFILFSTILMSFFIASK